jgi:hypothetical protein
MLKVIKFSFKVLCVVVIFTVVAGFVFRNLVKRNEMVQAVK